MDVHARTEGGTLSRSHFLPALAQGLALVGRQLLEALELGADLLLFGRRQFLESFKALTDTRALGRRQLAPVLLTQTCVRALRRRHLCPAVRSQYQPLLTCGWQRRPFISQRCQQLLLREREF